MATRKIKAGSYWKKLDQSRIFKAVEDHYSYDNGYFAYTQNGLDCACYMSVDQDGLVRCRKDGQFYKSSPRQHLNRKYLSLAWQLKGSIASVRRVAYEAKYFNSNFDIDRLESEMLTHLEQARRAALEKP